MSQAERSHHGAPGVADIVRAETGVNVIRCYQCGKCSAGCPLASDMDYPPSMIMRMLQTQTPEALEAALRSYTIWLCLSCETCYGRCPMEIDIPKVMDHLRQESLRRGISNPRAKRIIAFHRAFLDSIRMTGRLYEVGLIADYKTRTFNLFQDLILAVRMFVRGKLHLLPERVKGRRAFSKIFKLTRKEA